MIGDIDVDTSNLDLRWENYVLGREDCRYGYGFDELISGAVSVTEKTVVVMGLGFDPRANIALEQIAPLLDKGCRVLAVVPERPTTVSRESARQELNEERAVELAKMYSLDMKFLRPAPNSGDRRFVGLRLVRDLARRAEWSYDHVIIDVSSMPTSMFFAFISAWLNNPISGLQLQIVATENHWLDDIIGDSGVETPRFIPGFAFHGEVNDLPTSTRVWLPILGRGKSAQIGEISAVLKPDEVCPIIPFPALDPRRGDNLVNEYSTLLFEENQADPKNFIHADSSNPFDLYRSVVKMTRRYKSALKPLGDPVIVPSTHGSKLLSVGVLLAAHQESLSVINAGPQASKISAEVDDSAVAELLSRSRPTCMWLTGEPYVR